MAGIGKIRLKVVVVDSDRYAMSAINAYLAWDRRTSVVLKTDRLESFWRAYEAKPFAEPPDVFILDANYLGGADQLEDAIKGLRRAFHGIMVICLAQFADLDLIHAAAEAGAKAYWLKDDARLHIGWAVCACLCLAKDDFIVSRGVVEAGRRLSHRRLRKVHYLPGPKQYKDLTARKREAIVLNAIEGMSHRLVADEMGISVDTARGYIKLARRILESYHDDVGDYPADISPQEIDFMRITALELPEACLRILRG